MNLVNKLIRDYKLRLEEVRSNGHFPLRDIVKNKIIEDVSGTVCFCGSWYKEGGQYETVRCCDIIKELQKRSILQKNPSNSLWKKLSTTS